MAPRISSSSSIELLEKLAAITPRPAINLVLYHGVLAPRSLALTGRPLPPRVLGLDRVLARSQSSRYGYPGPVDLGRADAQRVRCDVLASPRCRGRLQVISTLQDPLAGQTILIHRARSSTPAPAALTGPASQSFSRGCPCHPAAPPLGPTKAPLRRLP